VASRIAWRDSFAVGEPLIDGQHRAFFSDLDQVVDAVEGGASRDEVLGAFRRFLSALSQHFRDEEALLARYAYPELRGHSDEHTALLASVTAIESLLMASNSPVELNYVIRTLFASLVEHLVSEDMRYKSWLHRHRTAAAP
jgi:hemerythrin